MTKDLLQPGWRSGFRAASGVRLHVVEAGRAGDPVVILLHGFPAFWWAWRGQIAPLADAGFHVLAPDQRGYHLSDKPEGLAAYRLEALAADVAALADAAGAETFDLVGHDWGAVIAWQVTARYPERVRRLVAIDGPHPDVLGRVMRRHPAQALRSAYALCFQLPWLPEAMLRARDFALLKRSLVRSSRAKTFGADDLERYAAAWSEPRALTAMLDYYRAVRLPRARDPAPIAPPTLVLWGERDRFLSRAVAEASVARCARGTLEVVPGASHWLHLEEPRFIAGRIVRFLAA